MSEFVLTAAGGVAIGLVVGWVFAHLRIAGREPSIDVVLSVLTPFAAYVPAEKVGVSGVLAVVTAGVYVGTRSLELAAAGARLRTLAFWQALGVHAQLAAVPTDRPAGHADRRTTSTALGSGRSSPRPRPWSPW